MTHIGNFLFHYPEPGGTTTAVRGMSRALCRLGQRVTIYSCGVVDAPKEPDGVGLVGFRAGRNPFGAPRALLERLERNEDRIDLLLIHGIFNPRNIAIVQAARRGGIPYVACPHGVYHPALLSRNRLRKSTYGLLFERPLLNRAAAVQVFAPEQIRLLADYGVRTAAFAVPNGFDPCEVPAPAPAERLEGDPALLYLGRISRYTKGLDLLFEALSLGLSDGKLPASLRLHLVGADWGDRAALERLADRLSIRRHVKFCGRVPEQRRWSVIASADALVLCSRHDAFPTVMLEAMAMARPVIASDQTGMSGYIREAGCGFLVRPELRSILAGLIQAVESRHRWASMGENGRAFALRNLTWDVVAQRASRHYSQILGAAQYEIEAGANVS